MKEYNETMKYLLKKTREAPTGEEARNWSQAVTNIAHVARIDKEVKNEDLD